MLLTEPMIPMSIYKKFPTPYYLINEKRLLKNMRLIARARELSGAKFVLALKCFATWPLFPLMSKYMDGTTSSSLYEARLGKEKFGGETHAYSVAFSHDDIKNVIPYADKIIFNSASQLQTHAKTAAGLPLGLRVNPGISYSHYDLADPARKHSRLGVTSLDDLKKTESQLSGLMFHFNCENDNFENFKQALAHLAKHYGTILKKMQWVSLGGGIAFTKPDYPFGEFCALLKNFSEQFKIQIYLEPGEAAITNTAELVTTVLDVTRNRLDIAIVDASLEAHLLDYLIYRMSARLAYPGAGPHRYIIAGRSCLAGDVFGDFKIKHQLKPGSLVRFADTAGYTMVKKNWFNGLQMPSICIQKTDGELIQTREFTYHDYLSGLG